MNGSHEIAVEIGGTPILVRTQDRSFHDLVADRYAGFVGDIAQSRYALDVDLVTPFRDAAVDEDMQVEEQGGQWHLRRGDFRAEWDPHSGRGRVRQSPNPYAIDSVLRIVHTLILAREGGFLLHAASAIRNGKAFLFSGVSGAGKTTISRLAPANATLLTDEISYIRRSSDEFRACGTPFAGELARPGENCTAPISTLFFLSQGPQNRIEPIPAQEAVRLLLRNILFFAKNQELVQLVFRTACQFVERVPSRRLTFVPDGRVWDLIR